MDVTAVTVTYGDRQNLVEKCLEAALSEGADRAVVVNNGGKTPISERMKKKYGKRIICVEREMNGGSAAGFSDGISAAMNNGSEYILLLDDDNCVRGGAIKQLMQSFSALSASESQDGLCVLGNRYKQNSRQVATQRICGKGCSEYLEFRIEDKVGYVCKKMTYTKLPADKDSAMPSLVQCFNAPYGGLFFHKSMVERFGLPDKRFVLYQDDLEFTSRVVLGGGHIWMDNKAEIEDVELSWHSRDKKLSRLETWLCSGSDLRVYYTARNMSYLETHIRRPSCMRKVNKIIYMCMLLCLTIRLKRWKRFRLLLSAIHSGEKGILGYNRNYPLD